MSLRLSCFLISCALLLPACVTTAANITDPSRTAKIEADKSTKSDVIALLGLPARVSRGDSGQEAWKYLRVTEIPKAASYLPLIRAFADGFEVEARGLRLTFDQNDVVKNLEPIPPQVVKEPVPY